MQRMPLPRPPLPPDWPYAPREDAGAWEVREGQDLGVEGAGWTLTVPADLVLQGSASPLEGALGRGGILRLGDLVLRPYRRGGMARFLSQKSYASPRRFEREWEIHCALWEAGFPTVQPLGYGRRRSGLAWEGLYLTRLEAGTPWPRGWGRECLPGLLESIRALSAWGLWAPDLNATNVLVTPDGPRLLDWDRAAFVQGADLEPLYRKRLARSLKKLRAPDDLVSIFT